MKKKIFNWIMGRTWFTQLLRERFDQELQHVTYLAFEEGCGLEDSGIQDRYKVMEYGWYSGTGAMEEVINNVIED